MTEPPGDAAPAAPKRKRKWLRRIAGGAAVLVALLVLGLLFWLRGGLYNRWVRFPREEAAWQALRAQRQAVTETAGWTEFRGALHTHSHLSHDSEVPFEHILDALKAAGLDFICLSDHCDQGRADFDAQWRGLRDGKLFIPGFEMREGFMPFGVRPGTVLSNKTDNATLARQIVENGGVLFYAHPEEKRDWDRPELTGLEIYNIHVDFKRLKGGLGALLPDVLLNLEPYRDHVMWRISRRPTEFLRRWDDLNRTRHITAISANDAHQNVGFRGFCTSSNTFLIEDTSPDTVAEYKLNWFTRGLARLAFGPLDPGRKLFHIQLDPYLSSIRFVNTHVLARELTEPAILDALRTGRAFVGFDIVADSSGFRWFAVSGTNFTVMGESGVFSPGSRLRALSPIPCRFTIVKDGSTVHQAEGRTLEWTPPGPGKYRVEAELKVRDDWIPWVYANPVELR